MKALQIAVFLIAVGVTLSSPLLSDRKQFDKLNSAWSTWKKLTTGTKGYVVQNHQMQGKAEPIPPYFVNIETGAVDYICQNSAPTIPPTKPTKRPFSVVVVRRVEEMFQKLKKILQQQLCKLVKIVYSSNQAYPIMAKLAGCKSPKLDGVLALGTVIIASKNQATTGDSLCKLAKHHSKALKAEHKKAFAAILPFIRNGPVLPVGQTESAQQSNTLKKIVDPSRIRTALKEVKKAISKSASSQKPSVNAQKLRKSLKQALVDFLQPTEASNAFKSLRSSVVQHLKAKSSPERHNKLHQTEKALPATSMIVEAVPEEEIVFPDETGFGDGLDHEDISSDDDYDSDEDSSESSEGEAAGTKAAGNNKHRHHHKNSHRHHHHAKVKRILFYTGSAALGVAILCTLVASIRACRERKHPSVKADEGLSYAALVEDECADPPPGYVDPAHCVAKPQVV